MNEFSEYLNNLLERNIKTVPSEDEYVGPDGLFYCKHCHTPTQCVVRVGGRERVVSCMCRCAEEKRNEREREIEERERQIRIQRLKASGIQERALHHWRFEDSEDSRTIRLAKRYADGWNDAKSMNLGLLLWGDVGTGKSYAAACIANELLERGVPVLMTNFSKILNQMGGMYSDERYRYIASLSAYDLLIIDDLGIERNTEYAMEQVYSVVDERYKSGKPLIITTNLTIGEMRKPADVAHARIYSRILEMCTPVQVTGTDRRRDIGSEKQDFVKELLFG